MMLVASFTGIVVRVLAAPAVAFALAGARSG
jgi:hypothetical protein